MSSKDLSDKYSTEYIDDLVKSLLEGRNPNMEINLMVKITLYAYGDYDFSRFDYDRDDVKPSIRKFLRDMHESNKIYANCLRIKKELKEKKSSKCKSNDSHDDTTDSEEETTNETESTEPTSTAQNTNEITNDDLNNSNTEKSLVWPLNIVKNFFNNPNNQFKLKKD